MKRLFVAIAFLFFYAGVTQAQKGIAEADYYPLGYSGETWTGEVTAIDNDRRTLTLTYSRDKHASTFVASIPDTPYERGRDARNFRVIDFPYDKTAKSQTFKYVGRGQGAGDILPGPPSAGIQKRPSPPDSNAITDLSDFMGRPITVYYTQRERAMGGGKEKYNDVWRIRILPARKK